MAPTIAPVRTSPDLPASTTVVVIGGGIIGLTAALTLAERGIPVVVLEKGTIAGEQSSRNLGWIRKTLRDRQELPLAIASERMWGEMAGRVGSDVGFRQAGIMYVARTEREMAAYRNWRESVRDLSPDSRLLTPVEIDELAPGGAGRWVGGIYTASDGRAEPTLASSAIARAAIASGAIIVENCAARSLSMSAGKVGGVITERGEIQCEQVLLAGGLWSRRFLGNIGIALPVLPLAASVIKTQPMEGPTEIAVGGPNFSFRRGIDGSFTIIQRAAFVAPLVLDSLLIGHRYLATLRAQWKNVRLSIGRHFLSDLALQRRWRPSDVSPFEKVRTLNPPVIDGLNAEAMRNVTAAWPVFRNAVIRQSWGGMIDMTPDSLPVISPVAAVPGLTLATGFSGHGFGISPAAGQLAADLVTNAPPVVDSAPYRYERLL